MLCKSFKTAEGVFYVFVYNSSETTIINYALLNYLLTIPQTSYHEPYYRHFVTPERQSDTEESLKYLHKHFGLNLTQSSLTPVFIGLPGSEVRLCEPHSHLTPTSLLA